MSPSPMRQASGVSEGALTPSLDGGSDTASEVTVLGPALPQRKGTLLLWLLCTNISGVLRPGRGMN